MFNPVLFLSEVLLSCGRATLQAQDTRGSTGPAIHPRLRCRYCSKWRNPQEFAVLKFRHISPCIYCFEAHQQADRINRGELIPQCYACQNTIQELRGVNGRADERVRLVLHRRDGVQQYLCEPCSAIYERKRMDLLAGTAYAARKKL